MVCEKTANETKKNPNDQNYPDSVAPYNTHHVTKLGFVTNPEHHNGFETEKFRDQKRTIGRQSGNMNTGS